MTDEDNAHANVVAEQLAMADEEDLDEVDDGDD